MSTALKVVGKEDAEALAVQLDQIIRSAGKAYIEGGLALMQMRDGQHYKDLPGHHHMIFEDYVASVEEMTIRYAQRRIRAALVAKALTAETNGAANLAAPPATENQARQLAEFVAKFRCEEREQPQGGFAKQPVEVSNPETLQKEWAKIQLKWQKEHERQVKEYESGERKRRPASISANWIRDAIPQKYKAGTKAAATEDGRMHARIMRAQGKITDRWARMNEMVLQEWVERDSITRADLTALRAVLKEAKEQIDDLLHHTERMRLSE